MNPSLLALQRKQQLLQFAETFLQRLAQKIEGALAFSTDFGLKLFNVSTFYVCFMVVYLVSSQAESLF